jgi:hypothetical protein
MKLYFALYLVFCLNTLSVFADTNSQIGINEALNAAQKWAQQNLGDDVANYSQQSNPHGYSFSLTALLAPLLPRLAAGLI